MIDYEAAQYLTHYGLERTVSPGTDGRSILRRTMRYLMDVAGGGTAWCSNRDIRNAIGMIAMRL